jgi:hypothetical protein
LLLQCDRHQLHHVSMLGLPAFRALLQALHGMLYCRS